MGAGGAEWQNNWQEQGQKQRQKQRQKKQKQKQEQAKHARDQQRSFANSPLLRFPPAPRPYEGGGGIWLDLEDIPRILALPPGHGYLGTLVNIAISPITFTLLPLYLCLCNPLYLCPTSPFTFAFLAWLLLPYFPNPLPGLLPPLLPPSLSRVQEK